jgi:hypothetical protein
MTEHVPRVEQREIIARLNEFERVVPIYRAALERIAVAPNAGALGREAALALQEADRDLPEREQ